MELFDPRVQGSSSEAELEVLGLDELVLEELVWLVSYVQTSCVGNPLAYASLIHTLHTIP